ncbi:ATP-binding protein [Luteolibacter flavescens]|uniref:histidine kinase n=1 Tax=Luteolibacter flavescens TaxID=1859460 RepID=A0ABT3FIY0_9BACT|nr:ATP-binding protein [Luteolibacter flavescens]MCW1883236.1 ATP-binding protein [Luteolibacter flavescens]
MTSSPQYDTKPPFWTAALVSTFIVAVFAWLRLDVFGHRVFPISVVLPLLVCLWGRWKSILHLSALVLSAVSSMKILVMLPAKSFPHATDKWFWLCSELVNIWVVTFAIHWFLGVRERLANKRHRLALLNDDLEKSNQELAAREEEIARQNEELQSQTEELEQQSEELRQQAEELEQQGSDLQELNRELMRREKGLETLLHSGRWMRGDMSESYVMSGVCQAALQIINDVTTAEVIGATSEAYDVWGDCGFGLQGRMDDGIRYDHTFARMVAETERTAGLNDIRQREDLRLPSLRAGRPLVSVIASPIWYEGKVVAALCIYGVEPREWTEHDFSICEWLASQGALALQSIRIQKELETRRRDAEEATIQKSQFLAAVSHDVRTPANAISLLAELIERASSDSAQSHRVPELARSMWANARSLVDLVSDVLDLTRLDSGPADLHLSEFALHEIIDAEVFQAETAANGKGLTIAKVMPAEPVRLKTDRTKMKRVIANLMSNAVKFTEKGSVRVECIVSDDVRISIADTGVGIPGDAVNKVFDEFFQLRNPERNREKGAGLGLAICRRLVSTLGCTLSVDSTVGAGSTFTLIIPAGLMAPPEAVVQDEGPVMPSGENPMRGLKVLLVEDNEVAKAAVGELLTNEGATVTAAADGNSALAHLAGGSFDVLLLDLNLPDIDGSEVLKHIQKSGQVIPRKIVITGDARLERVQQVRDLGADEVLAKPVSLAKIRSAILAHGGAVDENGVRATK